MKVENTQIIIQTCIACNSEFQIEISDIILDNESNKISIKTANGNYSDNVIFINNSKIHAAVKCPNCKNYNKIEIK